MTRTGVVIVKAKADDEAVLCLLLPARIGGEGGGLRPQILSRILMHGHGRHEEPCLAGLSEGGKLGDEGPECCGIDAEASEQCLGQS